MNVLLGMISTRNSFDLITFSMFCRKSKVISWNWPPIVHWNGPRSMCISLQVRSLLWIFSCMSPCRTIERLSMTFTANGKRQKWNFCLPSAVCTVEWNYLYLQWILVETLFHFCVLYLRIRRKELKIRSCLCRLPCAVNVMPNLSTVPVHFSPQYQWDYVVG